MDVKKVAAILTILLMSTTCFSQDIWKDEWLQQDKGLHIVFSAGLSMLGTEIAKDLKMKNPEFAGALFALACGMAKEYFYDKQPGAYDLGANIIGVSIGIPLNRVLQKWDRKKR